MSAIKPMKPLINRRTMIGMLGGVTATLALPNIVSGKKTPKRHIITLSFDDGFKKSSLLTASIYEKYKLSACINVIATGHLSNFKSPDDYQVTEKGDFGLWDELKARGHEVMPHGYKHANKTTIPLRDAQDLVSRCLDFFSRNLKGFEPEKAIFNMPYNASTPELEEWLATQVLAFRTGGVAINEMPQKKTKKLTCGAFGPGSTEEHLEQQIKNLLALPQGWLIYNTHGLDGEGWGPMRSTFLDRLLDRLMAIESVAVLPAGKVLEGI